MGLIDEIRKKRDSWTARLEEHRREREEKDVGNSDGADDGLPGPKPAQR